jgi:predicted transcriptional regulator of viral defense system
MNRDAWRALKKNLFFTTEDVAFQFDITRASAQVFCSRQVKNGAFVRLKKDFYLLGERLSYLEQQEFFTIANYLQVPSYISCTTALVYHGLTTQAPRGWYESVALKRSIRYDIRDAAFSYFKLKKDCYFGFTKIGSFFVAEKEKAYLDACHLCAHGGYSLDWSALDMGRLDHDRLETLMAPFPKRTRTFVRERTKTKGGQGRGTTYA